MPKLISMTGYALLIAGALLIITALTSFCVRWGFSGFEDVINPFNIWNLIAVAIVLAPGALLIGVGDWLAINRQSARP